MKKRIISLVLAIVLVCSMCFGASAVSTSGETNGLTRLPVTATLTMTKTFASATTTTISTHTSIHNTTVTYRYYNNIGQVSYASANGYTSATVYPNVTNSASAISSSSQHEIRGGVEIGTWYADLYTEV